MFRSCIVKERLRLTSIETLKNSGIAGDKAEQ